MIDVWIVIILIFKQADFNFLKGKISSKMIENKIGSNDVKID